MEYSEKYGKDVDEAVRLALEELGLREDQVMVTVLEEPSKGFLGLREKYAKVRVEKIEDAGGDGDDLSQADALAAVEKPQTKAMHDFRKRTVRNHNNRKAGGADRKAVPMAVPAGTTGRAAADAAAAVAAAATEAAGTAADPVGATATAATVTAATAAIATVAIVGAGSRPNATYISIFRGSNGSANRSRTWYPIPKANRRNSSRM